MTYSADGQSITTTASDGTKKKSSFSILGGTIFNNSTSAYGTTQENTIKSLTNARGQTVQKISPNGLVTNYSYTLLGQLSSVTNMGHGQIVRTSQYDSLGRLRVSTDPDTGTGTVHYNSIDQLDYTIDGNGNITSYAYDMLGRIIQTQVTAKLTGNIETTTYAYDNPAYENSRGTLSRVSTITTLSG